MSSENTSAPPEEPPKFTPNVIPDRQVDARGMKCPLPILRAKKALNDMDSGAVLLVIATDASAPRDFQAFSRQTGNALLSSSVNAQGEFEIVLRRR